MTDYPNSGALWRNDRKRDGSRGPDMTGSIELDGNLLKVLVAQHKAGDPIKMDLAAWQKVSRTGKKFLSISAKEPWQKEEKADDVMVDRPRSSTGRRPPKRDEIDDDDLPF